VFKSVESLENTSRTETFSSLILVGRSLDVDSGRPYIITLSLHRSRSVNSCKISEIWVDGTVDGFDVFDSRARTLDSRRSTLVRFFFFLNLKNIKTIFDIQLLSYYHI
jgi:hypothetical protein